MKTVILSKSETVLCGELTLARFRRRWAFWHRDVIVAIFFLFLLESFSWRRAIGHHDIVVGTFYTDTTMSASKGETIWKRSYLPLPEVAPFHLASAL